MLFKFGILVYPHLTFSFCDISRMDKRERSLNIFYTKRYLSMKTL